MCRYLKGVENEHMAKRNKVPRVTLRGESRNSHLQIIVILNILIWSIVPAFTWENR